MPIGKAWPNGTTLNIRFIGGSAQNRSLVQAAAEEWTKHANLEFKFNESPVAEIRIAFEDDGAWSYVGLDNLEIPQHAATMNFGWLDEGTVLHEFGHAIGLAHEHQNPAGGIQWNRDAVIGDLQAPPNNWLISQIEHNVLRKYSVDQVNGTKYDPESIMLYAFPAEWTSNGVATDRNEVLSDRDRAFVGSVYPASGDADMLELTVNEHVLTAAAIGEPGEEDLFKFRVTNGGRYSARTYGATDVIMRLYGPESQSSLIAEDDDSGERRNALIQAELAPGEYIVQVRHYNTARGTGDYRIAVSKDV